MDEQLREVGVAAARASEENFLLRALPPDAYAHLLPQLTRVRLRLRQVLVESNEPIRYVYFPREGVSSELAVAQDGGDLEIGTIGREGMVGVQIVLGGTTTTHRVIAQVDGDAWRVPSDTFAQLLVEHPAAREYLLRYTHVVLEQTAQSVACNLLHTLEERCARWLLMTHDRVPGDTFDLTHEFLALMLGVRRAGVTVAMGALQSAGLLRYTRGRVEVRDRAHLEEAACTCYQISRDIYARYLGVPVAESTG